MVYQNVGAVLTCAGLSTRMNQNKALMNWNGLTLIEQQINLLINSESNYQSLKPLILPILFGL